MISLILTFHKNINGRASQLKNIMRRNGSNRTDIKKLSLDKRGFQHSTIFSHILYMLYYCQILRPKQLKALSFERLLKIQVWEKKCIFNFDWRELGRVALETVA